MSVTLSRPVRRLIAIALPLIVLVFAASYVVYPSIMWPIELSKDVERLSDQLAKLREIAARKPLVEQEAASLRRLLGQSPGYWHAANALEMETKIQTSLREAVLSNGGKLLTISNASDAQNDDVSKITFRLVISGEMRTLVAFLGAVERFSPNLFVEAISITSDGVSTTGRVPRIDFNVSVAAYLMGRQS